MRIKILSLTLLVALTAAAQKKPLDHSVYNSWQSIDSSSISPSGKYILYTINPQEGDGQLVIKNMNGHQLEIPRGYRFHVTQDEKFALCLIKPFFKDTRQARIKKKKNFEMPKDTLAIIALTNGSVKKIPHVSSYKIGKKGGTSVAYLSADTALIPKKERDNRNVGRPLLVYNLNTEKTDTFKHITQYTFDKDGKLLAMTIQSKKNDASLSIYHVETQKVNNFSNDYRYYTHPVFNETSTRLLFLASNDTLETGSKHCELFCLDLPKATATNWNTTKPQRLVSRNDFGNLPKNWGLNENSAPRFSHDGTRIFAGVAEANAPKDTTQVPFETAGLDIWHWNADEIPPMMNSNLKRDLKHTNLAVYDPVTHQMRPLAFSKYDRIQLLNRGDAPFALSIDQARTIKQIQWDDQNEVDLTLIDLKTGKRRLIASGLFTRISTSPAGKFVIWFDRLKRQWFLHDMAANKTKDITSVLKVNLWDEDNDRPTHPDPYGIAGWTRDDKEVLIYDRYDIWKIQTKNSKTAHFTCLTKGEGRKNWRSFRLLNTKRDENDRFIEPGENMMLKVFDFKTKENGLACISNSQPAAPKILDFGGYTYRNLQKAKNANAYTFYKGNFEKPMDIYAAADDFSQTIRLSAINPQQKDYNWVTAELYHWKAYDGTPLDGILYKPEDFDPTKKYPVMVYFYERNSENLYNYIAPQPSWSIINLTFYASRGYIVFVPDIVYPNDGLPGEAAYNCICSGAESLKQFPWIDGENMAIQGQSWGGYQVAYLITRTNMFKAAGSGAPVSNMTSAYGGIRWESGMSRQFQYEHTQSRIGKTLWEAPELYLKNSCLFTLPNVQTPVLIMHNDADGAVPWYQGIEMFMGLRRLGKPAWMLQYNNEAHNLKERRNRKDLSIRLQQFFDHYLKGEPMPAWMKNGVPSTRKGQYFGLELAE